jgi:hypothetical protein
MVGLTLGTVGHFFFSKLVLVVASLCECSFVRTEPCPGDFMGNEKMMSVETAAARVTSRLASLIERCSFRDIAQTFI